MLELLEKFVAEVSSDVMTEIQAQPEVYKVLHQERIMFLKSHPELA